MLIKNVKIFTPEKTFVPGSVEVKEDTITNIYSPGAEPPCRSEEILDGEGAYCLPGFIDLHFHGCVGADFCDGTLEAIETIARYEASIGVTTICPATMTLPLSELDHILSTAAQYVHSRKGQPSFDEATLAGINMEGPFISISKKGAQDAAYVLDRDSSLARHFSEISDGLVRFIGIAPEMPGEDVAEFAANLPEEMKASLAHTDASYETAKHALDSGVCHGVHLFNGMSPFHHRDPGVVGAIAESPHATAELICDGIHLHPAVIRLMYQLLGSERIVLVSDSMRAAGLSDGCYTLGGQEVLVRGRKATLTEGGALAGSVTPLPDCVRRAVAMGIPLEDAVASATSIPAKVLGIEDMCGSIEAGKQADLVLWDANLTLRHVIIRGKTLPR